MAHDETDIRPQTRALDALIRETVSRIASEGGTEGANALLFLGNRHHAFPALVIQDPVLEPVDKLVWMVIYQSARGTGARAVFPSYRDIARMANVSSTSTVARAIATLRATRWLSLCARRRDAWGIFRGNVYALHDEPLPLADALHLDSGYKAFLADARRHHHAYVRRVAAAVSASLDEDIRAGKNVLMPENAIERRLEAIRALSPGGERRYFSFSASVLARLGNTGARHRTADQDQNSKSVDLQISNAASCSSSYIYKTTTTPKRGTKICAPLADALETLVFPPRLQADHRALAARYLARIPADQRQAVLDELAGRLEAENRGAKPIYDEVEYLHHLCERVNGGRFHPNLGLKVQGARERQREETGRLPQETEAAHRTCKKPPPRPAGDSPLAEMRKQLGMPPAPKIR